MNNADRLFVFYWPLLRVLAPDVFAPAVRGCYAPFPLPPFTSCYVVKTLWFSRILTCILKWLRTLIEARRACHLEHRFWVSCRDQALPANLRPLTFVPGRGRLRRCSATTYIRAGRAVSSSGAKRCETDGLSLIRARSFCPCNTLLRTQHPN